MPKRVWEAVKTKAREVILVKAGGSRKERGSRKETRRERTKEEGKKK